MDSPSYFIYSAAPKKGANYPDASINKWNSAAISLLVCPQATEFLFEALEF